ncbi:TPA: LOW QUALITY PROTEIN: hypothetical protein N0F65_000565, partial [Lagenidium giganteum]
ITKGRGGCSGGVGMSVVKIEDAFTDAAAAGDIPLLKELLAKGADVNDTDVSVSVSVSAMCFNEKEGYFALQIATKKCKLECVEFLIQQGANVNQRDSDGFTALHEAAFYGYQDIARVLLRRGADKSFVSSEGTTALQLSVRHGHGEVTSMLMCSAGSIDRQHVATSGDSTKMASTAAEQSHDTSASVWRYCMHIAYFGKGFVGWQRQSDKPTGGLVSVQEVVEEAVTEVLKAPSRVNVTCVSRTDAGTNALYQYGIIRVNKPLEMTVSEFRKAVNDRTRFDWQLAHRSWLNAAHLHCRLPENVIVHSVGPLSDSIVPSRIRSFRKKYIYYIQQGQRPNLNLDKFSWFIGKRVYPERLRQALSFLEGTHDFRAFSQGLQKPEFAEISTVRTLVSAKVRVRKNVNFSLDIGTSGSGEIVEDEASLAEYHVRKAAVNVEGNAQKKRKVESDQEYPVYFICIELIANGFLRHMVRRILGTIRPIGEGTYPPERMKQVLDGAIPPGPSAPTKGLWLHRTWLTEEDWDGDDDESKD